MIDFGFGIPAFISAGPQVWHIDNNSDQWRIVSIYPAEKGITTQDALAMGEAGEEQPEMLFSSSSISAGVEN